MAAFFYAQALEERDARDDDGPVPPRHRRRRDDPRRRGAASTTFADVVAPVALALAQEKRVTEQINGLLRIAREEFDFASEQFMQWFIKEQVEEVATMTDLLAVVNRNHDDVEDIEEYVAREQGGEGADPTAPRGRRRERLTSSPMGTGPRRRCRRRRADLRGPAARGRPPRRRAGPGPAAGDDLRGGRRDLVPLPRAARRTGSRPGPRTTYAELARLAETTPTSGVRMVTGTEVLRAATSRPVVARPRCPSSRETVDGAGGLRRRLVVHHAGRRHAGLPAAGWRTGSRPLGGTVTRLNLHGLPDRRRRPDAVVNCSGLGRQAPRGRPVGARPCGARWSTSSRSASSAGGSTACGGGPTYVVPRARDIVVGGTDDEGDWSRTPVAGGRRRDPAPGAAAGPGAARAPGAAAQGRAAAGAARGAAGTGGRRGALLRPRRRRGDAGLGLRGRGRGPAGLTG